METVDLPPIPIIILSGIIFLCCIGGMIAQIAANKRVAPDQKWMLRKDSLLRRRSMVYDEQGMRYVRLQRLCVLIMLGCFILIMLMLSPS